MNLHHNIRAGIYPDPSCDCMQTTHLGFAGVDRHPAYYLATPTDACTLLLQRPRATSARMCQEQKNIQDGTLNTSSSTGFNRDIQTAISQLEHCWIPSTEIKLCFKKHPGT